MSPDFPDLVQPVIGYRQWFLRPAEDHEMRFVTHLVKRDAPDPEVFGYLAECELRLESAGIGNHVWTPGPQQAECQAAPLVRGHYGTHPAPAPSCECGYYAWHAPGYLQAAIVAGAIAAWGRVEVHHDGFRAEQAAIVTLAWNAPAVRPVIEQVAKHYGVPCVPRSRFEEAAREHGIAVPEEMRPDKEPVLYVDSASWQIVSPALDAHRARKRRRSLRRWLAFVVALVVLNLFFALWGPWTVWNWGNAIGAIACALAAAHNLQVLRHLPD